jgi:dihydrofolate reductase
VRRVILSNAITIDGYFDEPETADIAFRHFPGGRKFKEYILNQNRSAGAILFGRKTYEAFVQFWPYQSGPEADLLNQLPKIVFSRSLKGVGWKHATLEREDAVKVVAKMRRGSGRDLLIFGSGELAMSLMRAGLIDEYRLAVIPLVLGGGTPMFPPGPKAFPMLLLEARPLDGGYVLLRYRPNRKMRCRLRA